MKMIEPRSHPQTQPNTDASIICSIVVISITSFLAIILTSTPCIPIGFDELIGICRHTEDELQEVVNDEAIDREKECIADGVDHKLICVGYQSFHRNTSLVIEADGR